MFDENDDRYREEPETLPYVYEKDLIADLRRYASDLKAEIIVLQNLVRDLDGCRESYCTGCRFFDKEAEGFCSLDLDNRVKEAGLFWKYQRLLDKYGR